MFLNKKQIKHWGLKALAIIIPNDELYLRIMFFLKMHKVLHLSSPKSFSEKLQWLKLHDKHPEYTTMVDKAGVKQWVQNIIGSDYIIPTLAIYNSVEEIDFDCLPNQFVLKCTHDSGGIVICKDKNHFKQKEAEEILTKSLKSGFYSITREYPYKNVPRKIIAEKYMEDESGYELKDYKFFCFNGDPKCLFVATDRGVEGEVTKFDFYDMNWTHLPFTNGHPNNKNSIPCPPNFEKMKDIAKALSAGIPHVRVDLYNINGKIYFGEMTFFHWGGWVAFEPEEWDYKLGEWLILPNA